jgi:predicted aconitase with swiveling domain
VSRTFKGRPIIPGSLKGVSLVTHAGFNTYASFYTSMHTQAQTALCSDSNNQELYKKNLTNKIICLPKTIGSTSGGAVWQRVTQMGIGPKSLLFSQPIDSLAAGGLIVAALWVGKRIITVDQLGNDFLQNVKDDHIIAVEVDGTVTIT